MIQDYYIDNDSTLVLVCDGVHLDTCNVLNRHSPLVQAVDSTLKQVKNLYDQLRSVTVYFSQVDAICPGLLKPCNSHGQNMNVTVTELSRLAAENKRLQQELASEKVVSANARAAEEQLQRIRRVVGQYVNLDNATDTAQATIECINYFKRRNGALVAETHQLEKEKEELAAEHARKIDFERVVCCGVQKNYTEAKAQLQRIRCAVSRHVNPDDVSEIATAVYQCVNTLEVRNSLLSLDKIQMQKDYESIKEVAEDSAKRLQRVCNTCSGFVSPDFADVMAANTVDTLIQESTSYQRDYEEMSRRYDVLADDLHNRALGYAADINKISTLCVPFASSSQDAAGMVEDVVNQLKAVRTHADHVELSRIASLVASVADWPAGQSVYDDVERLVNKYRSAHAFNTNLSQTIAGIQSACGKVIPASACMSTLDVVNHVVYQLIDARSDLTKLKDSNEAVEKLYGELADFGTLPLLKRVTEAAQLSRLFRSLQRKVSANIPGYCDAAEAYQRILARIEEDWSGVQKFVQDRTNAGTTPESVLEYLQLSESRKDAWAEYAGRLSGRLKSANSLLPENQQFTIPPKP